MSYNITIADVAGIVTACATVYLTFKANQNIGLILEDKETLYNTSSKPITICKAISIKGFDIIENSEEMDPNTGQFKEHIKIGNVKNIQKVLYKNQKYKFNCLLSDGKCKYEIEIKIKRSWFCGFNTYNIILYPYCKI